MPWKAKVLSQDYLNKDTSKQINKITSVGNFCVSNTVTQSQQVSGKQHKHEKSSKGQIRSTANQLK